MLRRIAFSHWIALGAALAAVPPSTTPEQGIRSRPPRLVAFTGARVIVAPGQVIDEATLVVEDGRVSAVGRRVSVPEGARIVALEGKTILPGFIDPYTDYGLPPGPPRSAPAETETREAPQYEGTRVGANAWNDAVRAERDWIEAFAPDEASGAKLLARGVTAVASVRMDGIFRGRGFVALLGPGTPNDRVLRPRGAQFAAFDRGSSKQTYPSSLMGAIALVRQTLLDADWYGRAWAAFERNRAEEMPEFNRAAAALAGYDGPFVFETDDELSLLRGARVGREFSRPLIHVALEGIARYLDEIAELGEPIILPLSFEERPPVETFDDELDVDLVELRRWERAPHAPRLLAERRVRFAFTGYGVEEREDFFENLRRVVRLGLAPEAALAALTSVPADLAGVGDLVGTLEPGKLANFLVVEGDLFADEHARIDAVWVGGRLVHEFRAPGAFDFRGVWSLELEGQPLELRVTGKPLEPTGKLMRGERSVPLGSPRLGEHRLQFFADLGRLDVGEGVARFALDERDAGVAGHVVLATGRRVPLVLRRTGSEVTPEDEPAGPEEGGAGRAEEERGKREREAADREIVSRVTRPDQAFGFDRVPEREDVLVRGATLWTMGPGGVLEEADLLIVDGRIEDVGHGLRVPRGARVIEATGKHVTPGLIDEHSHLAISEGVNEGSHAVTSEVRIGDVLDPDDPGLYRALAGGVTVAQLLHGSANPIGGQAQVIKLRWGASAEDLKFTAAPPTIKLALGENVKQSNWGEAFTTRYPQSRMGVEALLRDAFVAAREYEREQADWEALGPAERERRVPPRRDLRLDALLEVLHRERFVHCHSYEQAEILMLMRLAEELGFRVQTFTHVLEGYKVAPELAAHGAGASSFSDWWAYKFEVYDAIPYNTCLLHDAGVVTSINSDSDEVIRRLNQEAAKSVVYCDMDPVDALALATRNPAIQLRVADHVGSLETGKDGDFVIWSKNPLSMRARVEQTWIEGVPYFTLERDAERREADRLEKRALVQKALRMGEAGGGRERGAKPRHGGWHCDDLDSESRNE